MAFEPFKTGKKGLVDQSTLRAIRAGNFSRKQALGPVQTQAIVSADLEDQRRRDEASEARQQQLRLEKERLRQDFIRSQTEAKARRDAEPSFFQSVLGGT